MGVFGTLERRAVHTIVDRLHKAILKGDHHRDRLHHRTGLESDHSAVQRLAESAVAEALDIGYSLDLARFHLHQNGCPPFGVRFLAYREQFLFEHVLKVDVDGGHDIISAFRRGSDPVSDTLGERHFLGQTGCTVKQAVEVLLKTRIAVDLPGQFRFIDAADASVGHLAVGIDSDIALLLIERIAESASLDILQHRESTDHFEILDGALTRDSECAGTLLNRLLELLAKTPAPGVFLERVGMLLEIRHTREVLVECVGQRVERLPREGVHVGKLLVAAIEANVVDLKIAGKYISVRGEDVAAFGGNGVDF